MEVKNRVYAFLVKKYGTKLADNALNNFKKKLELYVTQVK